MLPCTGRFGQLLTYTDDQRKKTMQQKLTILGRKKGGLSGTAERHKLLSDDERKSLPADVFEPVSHVPD